MKKQINPASYFFFLALFLTSCSTKTSLTYDSVVQEQPKNHIGVLVDHFLDTRSHTDKIGALRNGYGLPVVKIITDDDVPTWMKAALEKELINAGYSIADEGKNGYHIKGKILKLSSGSYFTYSGKISIEISLNQGDKVLWEKQYVSKESAGLCMQLSPFINSSKQAIQCSNALSLSLQEIYKQVVRDVNQEIDNQLTVFPSCASG